MKTPAYLASNHYAAVAKNEFPERVETFRNIDCVVEGEVLQASLRQHPPVDENMQRPYLWMRLRINQARGDFPYNMEPDIQGQDGPERVVDVRYEFTDSQLSNLAAKGLFNPGFSIPNSLFENYLHIPMQASMMIVHPDPQSESQVAIPFFYPENIYDLEVTQESMGVDLAAAFENQPYTGAQNDYEEQYFPDLEESYSLEYQEQEPEAVSEAEHNVWIEPVETVYEVQMDDDIEDSMDRINQLMLKDETPKLDPVIKSSQKEKSSSEVNVQAEENQNTAARTSSRKSRMSSFVAEPEDSSEYDL